LKVAMQDAQVPTESEDEASDAPRRASLRLRDAEVVATARRDMFGDGSLLDTLAGPPSAPEATENPADPVVPTQPAEPSPPEKYGGGAEADAAQRPDLAEAAAPAGSVPFADVAQPIDAIIDSFPPEPAARPPQEVGVIDVEAVAVGPSRMSSLFDSLGNIAPRAGEAQPAEEPPPSSASAPDLDMSMLEVRPPALQALGLESGSHEAIPLGNPPPLALDPRPEADEVQAEAIELVPVEAQQVESDGVRAGQLELDMSMLELRVPVRPVLQPESEPHAGAAPNGAPPAPMDPELQAHPVESAAVQPGELDLDMAMLERPPARPVLQPDGDPSGASPPRGDPSRPAGSESRADGAFAQALGEPSAADVALSLQTLDTAAPSSGAADTVPYSGEPPQAGNAQPFIEPLVMSAFADPSGPGRHGEPLAMSAHPETADSGAQPMFDAAAKIAAEAQATAEALDNLKSLLQGPPGLEDPTRPPGQGHVQLNLHGDAIPFPPGRPPALMPMPVQERSRAKGIYVLGFLTGLGLSLMAGIALYILINII
jgi:hypothetical protein